jgi:hypothetical protein
MLCRLHLELGTMGADDGRRDLMSAKEEGRKRKSSPLRSDE